MKPVIISHDESFESKVYWFTMFRLDRKVRGSTPQDNTVFLSVFKVVELVLNTSLILMFTCLDKLNNTFKNKIILKKLLREL